jgi:predicted transcriptional regulator
MPPLAASRTTDINGYALRAIRKPTGITPQKLAESIDKDRTYIVKIERGTVRRVGTPTFHAIVAALGIEDPRALMAWPHAAEELAPPA